MSLLIKMEFLKSCKKIKLEYLVLFLAFFSCTVFFFLQHSYNNGWDFMVYSLNAKYLFHHGSFFEWTRPPLTSLLIGIFSVFSFGNFIIAEYLYILFVSFLFLFSCWKFSKRYELNLCFIYLLFLTPFFLLNSVFEGTELLSLSLVLLSIAYLGEWKSPVFMALAVLTRYFNFVFIMFYFFNKDFKKILRDLLIFFLVLSPWLLFNYFAKGDILASYIDSYALTVKFRGYMHSSVNFYHLFSSLQYLLPLGLVGIYLRFKDAFKNKKIGGILIIMLFIILATVVGYSNSPITVSRYLFLLLIPAVYFSYYVFDIFRNKKMVLAALFILFFISFSISSYTLVTSERNPLDFYKRAYTFNEQLIGNCTLVSNMHILLNYQGIESEGFLNFLMFPSLIESGHRILLFKTPNDPDYSFDDSLLREFPVMNNTDRFVILGNSSLCNSSRNLDSTYLEQVNDFYQTVYRRPFNITYYELFFTDKSA
jgi:hypothetical protein